jgi:hypothetical protein
MVPFSRGHSGGKGLVGNHHFDTPNIYLKLAVREPLSNTFYFFLSLRAR